MLRRQVPGPSFTLVGHLFVEPVLIASLDTHGLMLGPKSWRLSVPAVFMIESRRISACRRSGWRRQSSLLSGSTSWRLRSQVVSWLYTALVMIRR